MILALVQHLLRGSFSLRVNIKLAKVRVKLLESLSLGLWVAGVDQDGGKDIEGHEDEVNAWPDISYSDRPDLANDDGTEGSTRGRKAQALGTAVCWENLRRVNPGTRAESHAVYYTY